MGLFIYVRKSVFAQKMGYKHQFEDQRLKSIMKFVDEVNIHVASGKGGAGKVSFRREAMVARGGPDGGDGGKGGDVIIKADSRLHSLLDLKFKLSYKAADGEPGMSMNRAGKNAEDLVLKVPPGTMIKNNQGHVIYDMAEHSEIVLLKGGIGGKGNTFYKSSINQAPGVAQKGMPGEELEISLELKLLADVGIIGLPNAGKSTLISRISAARPKIADYPFTTLAPNLGVVQVGPERTFVVADIPGLIEGAHRGEGLGIQFLRHIERTSLFVHLVDASPMAAKPPLEAYKEIREELRLYDELKAGQEGFQPLSPRTEIIVLSKADLLREDELRHVIQSFREQNLEVMWISAAANKNTQDLVTNLAKKLGI